MNKINYFNFVLNKLAKLNKNYFEKDNKMKIVYKVHFEEKLIQKKKRKIESKNRIKIIINFELLLGLRYRKYSALIKS